MKGKRHILRYGIALIVFTFTACQVKRPDNVLPDDKMENVLYDYHIAKVMAEEVPFNESYKRMLYVDYVFTKHGITQADFDSSMVWYARNPDIIAKIYEKVNQRLKNERNNLNHLIALRDNKPKASLSGDSIDVWSGRRIYQLSGMPLDNKITFSIPSDTAFYNRDTLRWSVRFRFLNGIKPDRSKALVMAMQVVYEKDSIVSRIKRITREGTEIITLSADTLGKIKEIRGFIYYPMQENIRPLLADRFSLMRYHAKDSLKKEPNDSIARINARQDSLKRTDSADVARPVPMQENGNVNHKPPLARPRPSLKEIERR